MKNLHVFSLVLTIVVIFVFVNTNIKEKMTTTPNYVNIGCWYDKPIHAIPLLYSTSVTSIEHAKQIASANNATVFGIQYGGQLFLGNDINAAKQYGPVGNNACQTSLNAWSSLQNDVWVLDSSIVTPTNTPTDTPTNTPTNTPTSISANTPTDMSANAPTNTSTNNILISKIKQHKIILVILVIIILSGIYYYLKKYKPLILQQFNIKMPTTQQPTTQQPTIQRPITQQPTIQQPTIQRPITQRIAMQ